MLEFLSGFLFEASCKVSIGFLKECKMGLYRTVVYATPEKGGVPKYMLYA